MRWWAALVVLLLAPVAAHAQGQTFGPVHEHIVVAGQLSGAQPAMAAFNRRLLGFINDSSNVVYCTVSGATAVANEGVRLAAAGTTGDRVFFDRHVPMGPIRCFSATNSSRVIILEGR